MLNKKLKVLREKWEQDNLELSPPPSQQQILNSFLEIDKLISKDVLEFFRIVGGMTDFTYDSEWVSFWSLEQVVRDNLMFKSDLALFADFLINSHFYGFQYENENISSVYSNFETGEFIKIADSIEEFLSLYLDNPNDIF